MKSIGSPKEKYQKAYSAYRLWTAITSGDWAGYGYQSMDSVLLRITRNLSPDSKFTFAASQSYKAKTKRDVYEFGVRFNRWGENGSITQWGGLRHQRGCVINDIPF